MSNVSFGNLTYQDTAQKLKNASYEQQPEFGAIDKTKLQQDTVELANKTKDAAVGEVKENFVTRTLKGLGIKEPKKFVKSLALTLGTVVGLAVLGNRASNSTAQLGHKVDDLLLNNKTYTKIADVFKGFGDKIKGVLNKSKTYQDIAETFKNRKATPVKDLCRGMGRGFRTIFALTPPDIISKALKTDLGDVNKTADALKKLVGDSKVAKELAEEFIGENASRDNVKLCRKLSKAMADNLGCAVNDKKFTDALIELQKGKFNGQDVSEFINVDMVEKGLKGTIGSWWPVNIINSIGKKVRGDKWKGFCRGNLGDALVKFNAVDGASAKTKLGSLVQKSITVPTESISNFVNDKSGLGVFLCTSIMSLYNNVQDAPKEKKVATVADEYVGTLGSIAISTPLAFGATYGLATLKNLKGDTIISKGLKQIGKFFGMGLEKYTKDATGAMKSAGQSRNILARGGGGALRFALVMFIFGSMFRKPVETVIHKIFGKPYNKAEEEQAKQLEEEKKKIIPELGITQGEFIDKLNAHPEVVQKLQSDPKLNEIVKNNPKKLLDLLEGKEVTSDASNGTSQNTPEGIVSPLNASIINSKRPSAAAQKTEQTALQTDSVEAEQPQQTNHDTATYIPSSDFIAKSSVSDAQAQEINAALARADKILAKAEKYI